MEEVVTLDEFNHVAAGGHALGTIEITPEMRERSVRLMIRLDREIEDAIADGRVVKDDKRALGW